MRYHDITQLVDIRDVAVNKELSKQEKILDYLRQIKTPNICRCGDIIIESVFAEGDISLSDRLKSMCRLAP